MPGGEIAIADLDKEDGDFHADNEGVMHFGFERGEFKKVEYKKGIIGWIKNEDICEN